VAAHLLEGPGEVDGGGARGGEHAAALELDLLVGQPALVEHDDAVRLEPDDALGRERRADPVGQV
jgi:hypothetical protein